MGHRDRWASHACVKQQGIRWGFITYCLDKYTVCPAISQFVPLLFCRFLSNRFLLVFEVYSPLPTYKHCVQNFYFWKSRFAVARLHCSTTMCHNIPREQWSLLEEVPRRRGSILGNSAVPQFAVFVTTDQRKCIPVSISLCSLFCSFAPCVLKQQLLGGW